MEQGLQSVHHTLSLLLFPLLPLLPCSSLWGSTASCQDPAPPQASQGITEGSQASQGIYSFLWASPCSGVGSSRWISVPVLQRNTSSRAWSISRPFCTDPGLLLPHILTPLSISSCCWELHFPFFYSCYPKITQCCWWAQPGAGPSIRKEEAAEVSP